jgi:pimeloyl-ACP methyl ester carboxylesterase
MKKIGLPIIILLLLIIVPMLVTQVMAKEERNYQAVSLEETSYEEISFYNGAQDIDLGGMLFLPEGEGPYPAVVIIHGSGTSRRDNRWYLTITQYLQANGIAVLLPDKRGSEKSGGSWRSASFEDLSTDTVAAVDFLKTRDDLPITKIGIIGMSQGGFIAPMVASLSPDVAFVVDFVGAAVPIKEQLLFEENNNLREMGFLPGISNLIAYPAAWSIRELRQKDFWDAVGHYDPLPYWQ